MELYSAAALRKIDEVNSVVRPLAERLVQAIGNKEFEQSDLLAIYPTYFEYNRIKNEVSRMVSFTKNSDLIQEMQGKLVMKRNELRDKTRNCARCHAYTLFRPLLASSDYDLMASIVVKCLSFAFQLELENKLLDESDNLFGTISKNEFKTISLDVIWRELTLLFNQRPKDYTLIGNKFADLIFQGQPFEVLDGDNFRLNYTFLKAIFEAKQRQALRIQVISIIGPQNSGKSTLLNLMFGCDFSIDRCTRGILGSFIKATGESAKEFDYLLALDTEGLQSIEKSDREYDRQLILFAFAVSNMVIIVTKDQITEDFKTSLEICVDSLRKIEMARVHRPAVYFVVNQKTVRTGPSKRTDQETINKIIASFASNGLNKQLRLDDSNFATLPSAFYSNTIQIKLPARELRYCTTSPDFMKRVAVLAKTVVDQTIQAVKDEPSSSIFQWIEFSDLIFYVINNFPDLTHFNKIAARKQHNELQEFINRKLTSQLSNVAKETLFDEAIKKTENDEKAFSIINTFISGIKIHLTKDLDDYIEKHAVSSEIKRLQQESLIWQIDKIRESWANELRIKRDDVSLRQKIDTGEGRKHTY